MKTIIDYLNNMFAPLPKTKQLELLKDELLSNMEDKYNELKQEGKSENEAIGIVISEFGNIDELLHELEIPIEEKKTAIHSELTDLEVNHFFATQKRSSKYIGLGVLLCILAPAFLLLCMQLAADGLLFGLSEGTGIMLGVIALLAFVAVAVGLFIYSGMIMEKFKPIETGKFELPHHFRVSLEAKKNAFQTSFTKAMIVGVALCILSPVFLFITLAINENLVLYGVIILLLTIAVAVHIFIYYSGIKESYEKLLKIGEYTERSKEEDKVIGVVASIVWPLAICIFLISGLIFHQWHINWIVFPITGLLFGAFSGVRSILKEEK